MGGLTSEWLIALFDENVTWPIRLTCNNRSIVSLLLFASKLMNFFSSEHIGGIASPIVGKFSKFCAMFDSHFAGFGSKSRNTVKGAILKRYAIFRSKCLARKSSFAPSEPEWD